MVSQILIVMIAAIAISIFAERRNIQPPLLLALVGLAASFVPSLPRLELEPEILLSVVLPPLLFSAASEFSLDSFLRRIGSIANLGVVLVLVATAAVGGVAAAIIPNMTLPVALVLGAVVSPPDAVTAVAVGRKLGLPGRMMTVLKGESLINDAAALTLFTFAVAAVSGTHLFISNIFLYLLYSAFAGVVVGAIIGQVVHRARRRMTNPSLATVLGILVPFTAYLIAEELGASGVLAVVAAGFALGHNSGEAGYATRIQERQFWRTADALLEAFVFGYIGLQLRWVIQDAEAAGFDLLQLFGLSGLVLLSVIATRIAWVFGTAFIARWRTAQARKLAAHLNANPPPPRRQRPGRRNRQRQGGFEIVEPFSWRENLVISWTGMRGVVTLAAAAGIPLTTIAGDAFPGRDVIQAVAFVVTIGTLLVQGLTLPWLIAWLGISDPGETAFKKQQRKRAEAIADTAARDAIAAFRDRQTDPDTKAFAEQMLARNSRSRAAAKTPGTNNGSAMLELGLAVLQARRTALVTARDERQLDDEIMREAIEAIDLQEAVLATWEPETAES